eukprot:scaffold182207_cov21-Tisochrysis_lutea.AAC.1
MSGLQRKSYFASLHTVIEVWYILYEEYPQQAALIVDFCSGAHALISSIWYEDEEDLDAALHCGQGPHSFMLMLKVSQLFRNMSTARQEDCPVDSGPGVAISQGVPLSLRKYDCQLPDQGASASRMPFVRGPTKTMLGQALLLESFAEHILWL